MVTRYTSHLVVEVPLGTRMASPPARPAQAGLLTHFTFSIAGHNVPPGSRAESYPAVICLPLPLPPPTRPVRRLGAGIATGAVRAGAGLTLVRIRLRHPHTGT